MNNDSFVKKLVQDNPVLEAPYQEHLYDNGELLPHVFMGEVTRVVLRLVSPKMSLDESASSRGVAEPILTYLEQGWQSGTMDVQNLISVSFVENLTPDEQGYEEMKLLLNPCLLQHLEEYEQHGMSR